MAPRLSALRRQFSKSVCWRTSPSAPKSVWNKLGSPGYIRSHTSLPDQSEALLIQPLGRSFPYAWLRDSCQCPNCVHPSTRQKLHGTSDIPIDIRPAREGVKVADEGVHVEWATGHKSFYPISFLEHHVSAKNLSAFHKDVTRKPWDVQRISQTRNLFLPYSALQTPTALLSAITQLTTYGILFVSGVPPAETSGETCELKTLAAYFGEIRKTFYGETWDVKNVSNSRNIAYTNLFLGLHMDLLYFEHPPRYQILHCLRNRVHGGTSIFVDALPVASTLATSHRADFNILTSTPVEFHYINDGHHLHHAHPTIELDPLDPATIKHINYSPPFQAPLPLSTPRAFYPALMRFAALLEAPDVRFEYTLREGDAVLFDNRRVLHARTAFSEKEDAKGGETNRWLKGCYLEADAILDRGRMLKKKTEEATL